MYNTSLDARERRPPRGDRVPLPQPIHDAQRPTSATAISTTTAAAAAAGADAAAASSTHRQRKRAHLDRQALRHDGVAPAREQPTQMVCARRRNKDGANARERRGPLRPGAAQRERRVVASGHVSAKAPAPEAERRRLETRARKLRGALQT